MSCSHHNSLLFLQSHGITTRETCGDFTSSIIAVNVCLLVSLGQKVSFSTADNIGLANDVYHDENREQESHDEEDVGGGQKQSRPSQWCMIVVTMIIIFCQNQFYRYNKPSV